MAPRLPRMYWGEIIYATPGSGKTYVAGKYDGVWDADDLIVEAIKEVSYFDCSPFGNSDSRKIIFAYFRYIQFNRRYMNKVYECALDKMREICAENNVVLLGTRDLMDSADRVFIQENPSIVRDGFNSNTEESVVNGLPNYVNIHYIDEYLDNSLQRICSQN
mmetsp:Transcript_13092/g.18769  ORF Transcript_13092/g.18769 Transcript_13092/m.18769 type:complete len:162 (-) Transcript_13092:1138-1623(-)